MLRLEIPKQELWDERNEEFVNFPGYVIQLEHSLIALSRWEAIWHKPFLSKDPNSQITPEEFKSYIECMGMAPFSESILNYLTSDNLKTIQEYIENPMTATWFKETPGQNGRHVGGPTLTSEYLYYLMFENGIPKECEKWHLNRLITLIRVISEKHGDGKKMSSGERRQQYAAMKAARRKPKI